MRTQGSLFKLLEVQEIGNGPVDYWILERLAQVLQTKLAKLSPMKSSHCHVFHPLSTEKRL